MTSEELLEVESVLEQWKAGEITETERDEAVEAIARRGRASVRASIDNDVA